MVQSTTADAEFGDISREEAYTHGTSMFTGKVEMREGNYCRRGRMRGGRGVKREARKRARRSEGETQERRRARAGERNETEKSERIE